MCSVPAGPLSSFVTLLVVHSVSKLQLNLQKADSPELVVTQSNAHTHSKQQRCPFWTRGLAITHTWGFSRSFDYLCVTQPTAK